MPISPEEVVRLRVDRDKEEMARLYELLLQSIDTALIAGQNWHSLRVWDRYLSGTVDMWHYAPKIIEKYEQCGWKVTKRSGNFWWGDYLEFKS